MYLDKPNNIDKLLTMKESTVFLTTTLYIYILPNYLEWYMINLAGIYLKLKLKLLR